MSKKQSIEELREELRKLCLEIEWNNNYSLNSPQKNERVPPPEDAPVEWWLQYWYSMPFLKFRDDYGIQNKHMAAITGSNMLGIKEWPWLKEGEERRKSASRMRLPRLQHMVRLIIFTEEAQKLGLIEAQDASNRPLQTPYWILEDGPFTEYEKRLVKLRREALQEVGDLKKRNRGLQGGIAIIKEKVLGLERRLKRYEPEREKS